MNRPKRRINELPAKLIVRTEVFVLSASDNEKVPSGPSSFTMYKQGMQTEEKKKKKKKQKIKMKIRKK